MDEKPLMKISSARFWVESFQLSRPYTIAFRTVSTVKNVIVELTSATGMAGFGAGSPEPHVTGESFEDCIAALESFDFDSLKNHDHPFDLLQSKLLSTPAARAAIDIALHDLMAKENSTSLVQMLGQKHFRLLTSITIGIKPLQEVLDEAKEYQARGFRIIKLKLGKELELDIERTRRLKETVGDAMKIRVDLNQGYDLETFKKYLLATESCGLEFCEQPIAVNAFSKIENLEADIRAKIAADESLLTPEDAADLATRRSCGIFNIKLMKCGGVFPALKISECAENADIDLMWGCMDESRISITAALHAAFSCQNTKYLDLDGHLDLGRDIASGGFEIRDGWMTLTGKPGLGIEPDTSTGTH